MKLCRTFALAPLLAGALALSSAAFANATAQIGIPAESGMLALRVEVASTREQIAQGLMDRKLLPGNAGMLFVFPALQPPEAGFWMFRTRIPLEIAYLDGNGRIVAIRSMQPCTSPYPQQCPIYAPGVTYRAALEVNPGFFAKYRLGVGSQLSLPRGI